MEPQSNRRSFREGMEFQSNRISKEELNPGDHIYSWRKRYLNLYAHHGIYIGDDKVIHFTGPVREVGTGKKLNLFMVSSGPATSSVPCPTCTTQEEGNGVVLSCLSCFLAGGVLYRYNYGVSSAHYVTKLLRGTCTVAVSDPSDVTIHRAKDLLEKGFGLYSLHKNNCEEFAYYCKTGRHGANKFMRGCGQAASIVRRPVASFVNRMLNRNGRSNNSFV